MKEIPLTQGKVAIVDDSDFEWLNQYKWTAFRNGTTWYAVLGIGSRSNQQMLLMHRLIMQTPIGMDVDHANHDGLDNRRDNLRNCTRSQNNANQRIRSTGTSRFKGVSFDKRRGQWVAQLRYQHKCHLHQCFPTELEAAQAYDDKARELFGRFAHTNF